MISILIPTLNAAATLGPTLGALGPGLSAGVIREVIFADGGSTDDTVEIAEAVGARLLAAPGDAACRLGAAAAAAKGRWLLVLPPDLRLSPGWPEACRAHILSRPGRAGWFPLRAEGPVLRAAWANLRARATGRATPAHAVLAPAAVRRGTDGQEGAGAWRSGPWGAAGARPLGAHALVPAAAVRPWETENA